MTTTHTVREWLEQLPEPYRTQALENFAAEGLDHRNTECEDTLSDAIAAAFTWSQSTEKGEYWRAVYNWADGVADLPTPLTIKALQEPATKSPLSDLLDPSEGWTQEGRAFANEHGDSIEATGDADGTAEVFIILGEKAPYKLLQYKCPSILSAMAMTNQYRREQ